jgi:DNA repair photolyase
VDDGWDDVRAPDDGLSAVTQLIVDHTRSIITRNDSPDVPFDRSINPYKGCEHGCIYCFARPTHAYLGLSPGLDFETRIVIKPEAAELLRAAFARPAYRPEPIALGANTDPYQPTERSQRITRSLLEVMLEHRHPVGIITKSDLVLRDLDLLTSLAERRLAQVFISITTLDAELARRMEPRAAIPARRLAALEGLAAAGVPCGVLASPMIPGLNDHELDGILEAAARVGARRAGTILLRLPHELRELFAQWLDAHYPARKSKVLRLLREARGGGLNDARFGQRMRGEGPYAQLLHTRFRAALVRYGLDGERHEYDSSQFRRPGARRQLELFS